MYESTFLGIVGGLISGAALHACFQSRTRARRRRKQGEWKDINLDRFSGMERLLESDEVDQLRAATGFDPALADRLEAGRRYVLRLYLYEFEDCFDRLFQTALDFAVNDPEAPDDLAESLLSMRRRVWFALPAARAYLFARELGIPVPRPRSAISLLEMAPQLLNCTYATAGARA